jgi:transcriptional regulator with XRE-family HTH domain
MKDRDLSAAKLSRDTNIPKSTISEWLQGRQPKLDESVLRLAKYLKVSLEKLISKDEPEPDLVTEILDSINDGFAEIHTGVYRLKIEKYVNKKK